MHLYTHVRQLRQFAEETGEPFRYHIFIFVPEVEHVAQQIDSPRFLLDTVEKANQPPFLHTLMRNGKRPKVGIGKEIDVLHFFTFLLSYLYQSSPSSTRASSLIMLWSQEVQRRG